MPIGDLKQNKFNELDIMNTTGVPGRAVRQVLKVRGDADRGRLLLRLWLRRLLGPHAEAGAGD